MSRNDPLRIAVLISGGGTTLKNLLEKIAAGVLSAEIAVVVSSNAAAGGLEFAKAAGIPTVVAERRSFATLEEFSAAIFDPCRTADVDCVVMGGFLKLVRIPEDFADRVLNIHPSLIPKFCGEGYYGLRVHQAVLDAGEKVSGCTIHFVDNEYDHGPIVLQREVPVLADDNPETLARRVFAVECEAYPEVLQLYAAGKVRIEGGRVVIDR
ncbi:MAG: phosphoribosylglycinamide formyltransferase [Planctomycetota bacterium]|nr:MAG: phosphoribosylglycinamide formyltransferase [Planctomycetota bacterium]REJ67414.1 MAG: phosphoribosylglycinamide formyltransferase [Planctomycetota bacterium]